MLNRLPERAMGDLHQLTSSRRVALGDLVLAVSSDDPTFVARIDHLLHALPTAPDDLELTMSAVLYTHDLGDDDDVARWYELEITERPRFRTRHLWACEDRILSALNRWVLDVEVDAIHVHAGLVSLDGAGVLIVGPSGAGKSTLVAHLARSGWTYHSDELVAIDPLVLTAQAHPRPVTLKRGSWPTFAAVPEAAAAIADSLDARERAHIPAQQLTEHWTSDAVHVRLLVILDRDRLLDPPLTEARTVTALLHEGLDVERAGPKGFVALVRIAAQVPHLAIDSSDLDMTEEWLRTALAEEACFSRVADVPLTIDRGHGVDPLSRDDVNLSTRPALSEAALAVSIGTSGGVVYDEATGVLVELSPVGARAVQRMDGATTVQEITDAMSDESDDSEAVDATLRLCADLAHVGAVRLLPTGATGGRR